MPAVLLSYSSCIMQYTIYTATISMVRMQRKSWNDLHLPLLLAALHSAIYLILLSWWCCLCCLWSCWCRISIILYAQMHATAHWCYILHTTHTHTICLCCATHFITAYNMYMIYIYMVCLRSWWYLNSAWLACHGRLLVWLWCSTLLPAQYAKTDTRSTHTYNAVHIQIWDLLLCAIK